MKKKAATLLLTIVFLPLLMPLAAGCLAVILIATVVALSESIIMELIRLAEDVFNVCK